MERSNVLYLIIGENPMPNLVSIATRIINGGDIICFYTDNTENIFKNIKNLVEEKSGEKDFSVSKIEGRKIINFNDITQVKKQLKDKIIVNDKELFELNFTGGTKVLSSVAFEVFKTKVNECNGRGILSYFDGESERVSFLELNKGKRKFYISKYYDLEDFLNITAEDIVNLHNTGNIKLNIGEVQFKNLSNRIAKEVIENRENAINFLEQIYGYRYEYNEGKYKKLYREIINKVLQDNKLIYLTKEEDFYEDKICTNMSNSEYKKWKKALQGFWFEHYIEKILLELKEEGIIQSVFSSVTKEAKKDKQDFEVDLIVYSNFTLRCISVTTIDNDEEAKFKLYEVKARAYQLCGDVNKVAYVNLCPNNEKLLEEYRGVWENKLDDVLIISHDKLKGCKELIKNWVSKES